MRASYWVLTDHVARLSPKLSPTTDALIHSGSIVLVTVVFVLVYYIIIPLELLSDACCCVADDSFLRR